MHAWQDSKLRNWWRLKLSLDLPSGGGVLRRWLGGVYDAHANVTSFYCFCCGSAPFLLLLSPLRICIYHVIVNAYG